MFEVMYFCIILCRYSIDKMSGVFSLTLAATLCLDDTCEEVTVFNDLKVPIPLCYTNYISIELPGDGTIQAFAAELGGNIGDAAVSVVLGKLGLVVSISEANDGMSKPQYSRRPYFIYVM